MKRRDFLSKAGLGVTAGVIGASALSTPAISGGHKTINVVSTWPRDFPGLGFLHKDFVPELLSFHRAN